MNNGIMNWYGSGYSYADYDLDPPPPITTPAPDPAGWTAPRRCQHGLVLGRFLPLHRGREYLLQFAAGRCAHLTVAVRSQAADFLSAELREQWLRQILPVGAQVFSVADPGELPNFSEWLQALGERLQPVDVLFSSEVAHSSFARRLQAEFVCVDPERKVVPISATTIRTNPLRYWDYLSTPARPHFVKSVRVVGPDGAGKTTLSTRLARAFATVLVPEFAVQLAAARAGKLLAEDFVRWAEAHVAAREALKLQARRLLFLDSDLETVALWAERLLGKSPPWTRPDSFRFDLTLLLPPLSDPDGERRKLFDHWLRQRDDSFVVLEGSADHQLRLALKAIQERWQVEPDKTSADSA